MLWTEQETRQTQNKIPETSFVEFVRITSTATSEMKLGRKKKENEKWGLSAIKMSWLSLELVDFHILVQSTFVSKLGWLMRAQAQHTAATFLFSPMMISNVNDFKQEKNWNYYNNKKNS